MDGKTKVLSACIKKQKERIKDLEKSFEGTKRREVEAPTSRQSWSDTTRFQEGNLALGLQKQIEEAKMALDKMEKLDTTVNDRISVGALFTLKDKDSGKASDYFLAYKDCGGGTINTEGREVMIISEAAPLAEALIGREKGDSISFGSKALEVTDVQ